MNYNHGNTQQNYHKNTIPIQHQNMTNKPAYVYNDQPYRHTNTVQTNAPYNNHTNQYNKNMKTYNNLNQYNTYKHANPQPINRKVKSVKIRQKNRMHPKNDLPPNNPNIPRNRSKTEGQNILQHNKNASPLYMSTTQQIYSPPPPAWQQQSTMEERVWNNNYVIHEDTSDISYPTIPAPHTERSGTIIVHRNQPTYGNQFGTVNTHNNIQNNNVNSIQNGIQNSTTNTGSIPFAAVTHNSNNNERHWKQCPLRYMGCEEFESGYNINEHYKQYQQKHLDYIIIYFNSKMNVMENNYIQKMNHLQNENMQLKNKMMEIIVRMDEMEKRLNHDVENDKLPIRRSVHSRIPQRNKPTESKVPASFLQFQKSKSTDPSDTKE